MFHREIIINYGELDTAKDALAYYIQALTGLQEGIREVWTALENGEGEAHDALMTSKELLSERISRELEAAEDTRSVLESYIADMTAIITPDIRGQRMLVDRNDIWGNMVTMGAQIGRLGALDYFVRVWAWETCTPRPDERTRRKEEGYYRRVQAVKNDIILPYGARIAAIFEEMQSIYDNQVKAYENMDDEYEYLTEANYRKHTDSWEIAYDDLASFCTGIKDFVVGFVQGAVDVVVGLMNVVIGLVCLLASGIIWGVCELCGLDTPDWASDKLEQAGSTATALLEDPLLIVEGISQGATDAVEQKGICYCAGYLTGSIMADKGLSEGLLAPRSTSAVSGTGTISTTGKLSAEGMSHVDDVTRAGVRSLDDLDDLARAGAKTLDSVEDVVSPTLKTLDKVEDASKPLAKVDDIPNPGINSLDDVGKAGLGESGTDVDFTIMLRNSSRGNPSAITHFDVELSVRQKNLLQQLPNCDSSIVVNKCDVNLNDLAALTAKTGDEFAMFTRGSQRMIMRGNSNAVNINGSMAQELYNAGFKWSGHTHPGTGVNVKFASEGDMYILEQFNQTQSIILDSQGNFSIFEIGE